MAYIRPGVQVTQRQETVSPTLIAPDLTAAIVGPAYRIVEISERDTDFTHSYSTVLGTTPTTTIALFSGVSFDTSTLSDITVADSDMVYVDIVGTRSDTIGSTLHIPPGHESLQLTPSTNSLVITRTLLSGITTSSDIWISGIIKVGWRAMDSGMVGQVVNVDSLTQIEGLYGKRIPENPLAFGLNIAMSNAGSSTFAAAMGGTESGDHDDVRETIAGQEVYAIAPMAALDSGEAASWGTHCTNRSAATEKMERICFGSISRTFDPADKSADASTIQADNLALGNKRFFSVHPPVAYYNATRHISTIHPTYLNAMNGDLGLNPILNEQVKLSNGTTYYKGQEITSAVWSGIQGSQTYVNAYIPLPGYFWCAAVAGQVAGLEPEQGHTNVALGGGLDKVKYSSDYFSQAQLNTIAQGGTYIITQSTPTSPAFCRHQLSTDMTSIETRELSVTKVLDFVSKFIRNGLAPYIGTYNLTDKFIKLMSMNIEGMKNWLIREEIITDLVIQDMAQDPSESDVLNIVLDVGVPYPVNYIRITLTF